jgi:GH25 family lysozyme M1 (1,4-beta-N-acetylmuramidase)
MIHGIDVSAYQSETYSTAGIDFVIVKATEGLSYVNPRLSAQTKRARDAGLVVGFYHYPHMANDPIAEANYFLKQALLHPGDIVVFDWEGYDAANQGVPKSRQVAYRDAWMKYVKSKLPSHKVGMYCNTDYWLNVDKTSNCGDFLWIATGGKPAGQPGIDYAWTIHQYSTAGGIDHDVANFADRAALAAWAAGTTAPQENDMQLNDLVKLGTWVPKAWPKDAGLQDGTIQVNTALGSAYGYSRLAAESSTALLAQVAALTATVGKLAEGGGLDAAEIQAAAQAGAQAALDKLADAINKES